MGQFGSLHDQMKWSARNQNLFAAVNYEITNKWSLFGNFVWNNGRGSLGGISLDTRQIAGIPAGFNYAAVSEIGRYSALNGAYHQDIAGVNYQLSPNAVAHVAYFNGRYKDRLPYLMDGTGRTQGAEAGVSYTF